MWKRLIVVLYRRVNTSDLNEVASAIGPWTKLVWLESPTNPRQQISDIRVSHANQQLHIMMAKFNDMRLSNQI